MKYLIYIFVILTTNANSQIKFNVTDSCMDGPTIRNIVAQSDNYYSVGGSSTGIFPDILGVVVNHFGLNGGLQNIKYFADTIDWYHGVENSLKETGTGNYILGSGRQQNYYRDNQLIKFDNNFDTIFTKRYFPVNDGGNSDVIIYNSAIDSDGNYLLVGNTNIDNNYTIYDKTHMQLIKTDTLGNLLWRKIYGNTTYTYYGYKVVPAFGGGYLLGGYCSKNGGDNCIIKVDENGNNPEFKYFGHPSYSDGRIMGITPTKDTCYIITASKEVTSDGLDKGHIFKFD